MQQEKFSEMEAVKERYSEDYIAEAQEDEAKRDVLIRECHHLMSAERIRQQSVASCLERQFVDEIACVSSAHTKTDLTKIADRKKAGQPMRLQLLAALLRLADELDLDYRRVRLDELEQAMIPKRSKAHWWKCHYVESVDILEERRIQISFRFSKEDPDEVVELVPDLVVEKLKQELTERGLQEVLWPHVPVKVDEPILLEPSPVDKQPVPAEILKVFRQEHQDINLQRALRGIEPLAPSGPGKLTVTFGEHPENMVRQARGYWQDGQRDRAIATLEQGISLAPESAPLHGLLADAHSRMGHLQLAKSRAQEAIRLNAGSFLGRLNLGIVLSHEGSHRRALDHLRIAELASSPIRLQASDGQRLFLAIARCLAGLGDFWYAGERIEAISDLADSAPAEPDQAIEAEQAELASRVKNKLQLFESEEIQERTLEPDMEPVLSYWTPEAPFLYEYGSTPFTEGILLGGSSSWIDYAIECEFQILSRAAGFFLRADACASTGLMMQFKLDKLRRHQELHSNYFLHKITKVDLPTPLNRHEWHTVRFELSGNRLRTHLDGELIDEWADFSPRYSSGKFGFRLYVGEFALYRVPRATVKKKVVRKSKGDAAV
jgi:tetratricopeptide (TPR) repeat protein